MRNLKFESIGFRGCSTRDLETFPQLASAPEGIRTPNLLIRSQMLYPLSYGRRLQLFVAHVLGRGGGERI